MSWAPSFCGAAAAGAAGVVCARAAPGNPTGGKAAREQGRVTNKLASAHIISLLRHRGPSSLTVPVTVRRGLLARSLARRALFGPASMTERAQDRAVTRATSRWSRPAIHHGWAHSHPRNSTIVCAAR